MTEFYFNESMTESDLLGFNVRPGDTIYLSGILDTPSNSRFDLTKAVWNGTEDNPVVINGHDSVVIATNRKAAGGWRLVRYPVPHYTMRKVANLLWMIEDDNFIPRATGKPADSPEEWHSGDSLWFDDDAGNIYYKPKDLANANDQVISWSSGQPAFNLSGKRHIHLEHIDVSNCHTGGGNILISRGSRGIVIRDTDSYLGCISIYGGENISLNRVTAHDYPAPIVMQNPAGKFRNVTLDGIYVYNCDRDGRIGHGDGDYQAISFRGNVVNMKLCNIRIDKPVRDGISLYQHRKNKWDGVEVTLCYVNDALDTLNGIHSGGILLGGDSPRGKMLPKDNIHIHHNVITGCGGYGLRIKEYPASSQTASMRVHDNYSLNNGAPDQAPMAIPPSGSDLAAAASVLRERIIASSPTAHADKVNYD